MMFLTFPPRPKMAERVWEQKKSRVRAIFFLNMAVILTI